MNKLYFKKGFTLVEMIVSIAIFFIVVLVAMGAVLKTLDANKKSQAIKTVITNISFAFETMTREMRVGSKYNCTSATENAIVGGTISGLPSKITGTTSCSVSDTANNSWIIYYNSSKVALESDSTTRCSLIYAYYFDRINNALWKGTQSECGGAIAFYPLIFNSTDTSNNQVSDTSIVFETATVRVENGPTESNPAILRWPYVQFHLAGYAGTKEKLKTFFDIQTTVSQRLSD